MRCLNATWRSFSVWRETSVMLPLTRMAYSKKKKKKKKKERGKIVTITG